MQITSLIDIQCTLYEATTSPSDEEVLNQSPTELVSSPITYGAGETPTGSRRSTATRSGTQLSTRASTTQTLVDSEELGSVGKEKATIPPTHASGNVHEITNVDHEPLRVVSTLPATSPLPPATLARPPLKFDVAVRSDTSFASKYAHLTIAPSTAPISSPSNGTCTHRTCGSMACRRSRGPERCSPRGHAGLHEAI
jgi:hypothetical protein